MLDKIKFKELLKLNLMKIYRYLMMERNLYSTVKNSLAVDNDQPSTGGRGVRDIRRDKRKWNANFGSQNRKVNIKRLSS